VWAGWNFWTTYLFAPEGLSQWVSVGMGVLCFGMTCFGTWIILGVKSTPHCNGVVEYYKLTVS